MTCFPQSVHVAGTETVMVNPLKRPTKPCPRCGGLMAAAYAGMTKEKPIYICLRCGYSEPRKE